MTVFSIFRSSKSKAKKEAKGKEADRSNEPAVVKIPYKHVVTHAARDSQSVPGAYTDVDRPLILAHHRRRGELAMRRQSSFHSTTSSMNETVTSMARSTGSWRNPDFPGNGPENTYNLTWKDRHHMGLETTYEGATEEGIEGSTEGSTEGHYDTSSTPSASSSAPSFGVSSTPSFGISSAPSSASSTTACHSASYGGRKYILESSQITLPPAVLVKDTILVKTKTVTPIAPPIQPQKKSRWSLRGKTNNATISVSA